MCKIVELHQLKLWYIAAVATVPYSYDHLWLYYSPLSTPLTPLSINETRRGWSVEAFWTERTSDMLTRRRAAFKVLESMSLLEFRPRRWSWSLSWSFWSCCRSRCAFAVCWAALWEYMKCWRATFESGGRFHLSDTSISELFFIRRLITFLDLSEASEPKISEILS